MFTTKFKVTLGVIAGAVIAGALGVNQLSLEKKVNDLSNKPLPTVTVVAPTVEPTATPSATPTVVLRRLPLVVPSKAVVK